MQLNIEVVDAHTLLESALDICQAEIDRKQLVRSLHLGAQKVHLQADPARLQQIFFKTWSLINNAVKFTPKDGWISISTSNDSNGQFQVEIADSGLGIEPNLCRKFSTLSNKAGEPSLEVWVLVWQLAKGSLKRTTERSVHKAAVKTKAPLLR